MPVKYNGKIYRFYIKKDVRLKINEIIMNNINYGLWVGDVNKAKSRNKNLKDNIENARNGAIGKHYATLPDGSLVFRREIDSVPVGDKREPRRLSPNLRYFLFIIFNGRSFRAEKMFGSMENWKDGYLKDELKATINESLCRFNRHVFLSHYLERGRRAIKRSLYSW